MELFTLGTTGTKPDWYKRAMAAYGINADKVRMWFLDDADAQDWSLPAAYLLDMPPGYVLLRHGHPCERFEVVVKGSLQVGDGRVAGPGDVFTARANTLYGPHTAGPEGCVTIEIFSRLDAMTTLLYEGPEGEILVADALKGELPPDYIPLPSDKAVVL